MSVDAAPWAVDGVSTGSEAVRKFQMGLLGSTFDPFAGGVGATDAGAHGVTTSGALLVTQSATPAMTVRVAAGSAFIRGTASAMQGVVPFHNTAAVDNLTISVGDATNPRHDLVCAQHRNNDFDASGFQDNRLFVVEGTPAATPVDPTPPDGCLVLARVVVDAGESTSILNADITDLRTRGGWFALRTPGIAIGTVGVQNLGDGNLVTAVSADTLDPLNWHSAGIYTPDIAGWYRFSAEMHWGADTDYTRIFHILSKNDSSSGAQLDISGGFTTTGPDYTLHAYFNMNGTTDTLRLKCLQTNTSGGANAITGTVTVLELVYPT